MTEKTEWEVVDGPSANTRQTPQGLLKALLGPHWRWKVAGTVIVAGMALMLFAAFASLFLVGLAVVAILSLGIGKLRQVLYRGRSRGVSRHWDRHGKT